LLLLARSRSSRSITTDGQCRARTGDLLLVRQAL
jgi:hypothetical protein